MSVKNIVYSYRENEEIVGIPLALINPRDDDFISVAIETIDKSDFAFSGAERVIKTYQSRANSYNIEVDKAIGVSSLIIEKPKKIVSLKIYTRSYNFDVSELKSLNNLRTLVIDQDITLDIKDLTRQISNFQMNGGAIINDYAIRNVFTFTPMRRFILRNNQGVGLTSGAVDNLLEDLSLADWTGVRELEITGINNARTSASDAFVATLESKGVTVVTN